MPTSADYSSATFTLTITGTTGADTITASRNGAGTLLVNGGAIPITGGTPTIANTTLIVASGNAGNDTITLDQTNGALPAAQLFGGAGNDKLTGGSGADTLDGGDGNDVIDGQQGNDLALLGAGNDVFQWDPGDGSDTIEGQAGTDTLLFNGSAGNEIFAISANGGRVLFTRNLGNIVMDLDEVETITVNALGGADQITINDLSGTDVKTVNVNLAGAIGGTAGDGQPDTVTVNGTNGNNTLTLSLKNGKPVVNGLSYTVAVENMEAGDTIGIAGLDGNDVIAVSGTGALPSAFLSGGAGNDVLTGGSNADILLGDANNDTLLGKGGDDQMFGGAGDDRMVWNNGDGTDLMEGGDDVDIAEVNGSNGAEVFTVTANGTRVRFDRLGPDPFALDIGTTETLVLKAGGGNDSFSATGNLAALISITVDGGAGNDTLLGSNGTDTLIGGTGNDFIDGQQGNDIAFLGAGNDVFQWDPGDGSDTIEGQAGTDTLLFNGSAGNEIFAVSANGGRVLFTRNVGNIVMDLDDVETITVNALGGTDQVTINDLSGTDVKTVNVNLAGAIGGGTGDGLVDALTVHGTGGANMINVSGSAGTLSITGLPARVTINQVEAADQLAILGGNGNDRISAVSLTNGVVSTILDGGAGNDTIKGSNGADILFGGAGKDTLTGGAGADIFVFNTALNAATNVDRIADYSAADDTIQLENAIFTALAGTGTLTAGQFLIGSAAQDADDRIIYNSVTGALMYDADGNGAGAAIQFATLSAGLGLTSNDFFVL